MILASGILYSDVSDVIERIAENKARQYKSIAYLDQDDIKQEVRLKCFLAIKKFDKERAIKSKPFNFLSVCADNKIRDIKRTIFFKYYNKNKCKICNGRSVSGVYCSKCQNLDNINIFKMSLNSPASLINGDNKQQYYFPIHIIEAMDYVKFHLPSGLLPVFNKLGNLNFDLNLLKRAEKYKISKEFLKLLKQYYQDKE